jgi:hypothetical protein
VSHSQHITNKIITIPLSRMLHSTALINFPVIESCPRRRGWLFLHHAVLELVFLCIQGTPSVDSSPKGSAVPQSALLQRYSGHLATICGNLFAAKSNLLQYPVWMPRWKHAVDGLDQNIQIKAFTMSHASSPPNIHSNLLKHPTHPPRTTHLPP